MVKEQGNIYKFFDKHCNRFFIPFEDMVGCITDEVLVMLSKGYALTAYNDGENNVYTLFNVSKESVKYMPIETREIKDFLYDKIHTDNGCHYFVRMSLEEYFANEFYQRVVDDVLLSDAIKIGDSHWTIALRCSDSGKVFELIQVKDCFF